MEKAAFSWGVQELVLEEFFQNTSEKFRKNLHLLTSYPWEEAKQALNKAREHRQSNPRRGVNKMDRLQPLDLAMAKTILQNGSVSNPIKTPKPAPTSSTIDLTNPDKVHDTDSSDKTTSVLRLHELNFHITRQSLITLQPGKWLTDEIINGALHLIKEVSNDKVQVVDSLSHQSKRQPARPDFLDHRVLLPMLIRRNHWVVGVYEDRTGLLVYDSQWESTTKDAVSDQAGIFFSKILQKEDDDYPQITITAPLIQSNSNDCGVLSIAAAFHKAMGLSIEPTHVNPAVWRDFLLRLLRPQSDVDEHLNDSPPVKIELPCLPSTVPFSELPGALAQFFHAFLPRLRQWSDAIKKALVSRELVLKISRLATGATNASADAMARFQRVDDYYKAVVQRLRAEEEQARILMQSVMTCRKSFSTIDDEVKHTNGAMVGIGLSNSDETTCNTSGCKRKRDGSLCEESDRIKKLNLSINGSNRHPENTLSVVESTPSVLEAVANSSTLIGIELANTERD